MHKVSFPHFANYCIPIRYLVENGLGVEYIIPPPMTKRTLELGTSNSPDYACAPFKIHLGCFIEAIEAGADTLIQVGGACRLGYYGELHEQILRDLGFDGRFINLAKADYTKPKTLYDALKELNPDMRLKELARCLLLAKNMVGEMDKHEDYIRKYIGFEDDPGLMEEIYEDFLVLLREVRTQKELKGLSQELGKQLSAVPKTIPGHPLRVGVVGEYYSIMDPFSNHDMEIALAKRGVLVDRWMNVTNSLFHYDEKDLLPRMKKYTKYNMGATAMGTVESALRFAKKGYDGIIHLKSFGCTPEMDAMPVLQNISKDYRIPILYFSFDSQTGDAGIQTRLEAFYDMITMRKEGAA
ncbi:hypothetical protein LJC20_07410 [Eubacteriales bacterium OttesenSCG-928-M02]|nr:hypothetical protein [Eubacteriales bacterium OttesenSCG-928-M02]